MGTPKAQDPFNPFIVVCPTGKPKGRFEHYQAHLIGETGHFIGTFKLSRGTPIQHYATKEVERLISERKWNLKNIVVMTIGEDCNSYIV